MRGALLALVAAALVVPVAAVAADGQPTKALTNAGQSIAKSVLLERGDLGTGFAPVARDEDQHLPKGARCSALDETDLTVTGDAASPDFRFAQGTVFVTVGSTAAVYRTLREANTSWSRGSTKQTTTCLGDIVRLSAAPGQKITRPVGEEDPVPVGLAEDDGIPDRREHHHRRQPARPRLRRRRHPPARTDPDRTPLHVARTAGRPGHRVALAKVVAHGWPGPPAPAARSHRPLPPDG